VFSQSCFLSVHRDSLQAVHAFPLTCNWYCVQCHVITKKSYYKYRDIGNWLNYSFFFLILLCKPLYILAYDIYIKRRVLKVTAYIAFFRIALLYTDHGGHSVRIMTEKLWVRICLCTSRKARHKQRRHELHDTKLPGAPFQDLVQIPQHRHWD
jgi:hypothetical protein